MLFGDANTSFSWESSGAISEMFLWRHGIGGGDFSLLVSQGDVKRYISNGGSET